MTKHDVTWTAAEKERRAYMAEHSLYRAEDEHASCGVGLVVSIDGKPSRKVVENGIDALKAVWHRGAVDANGTTMTNEIHIDHKPDSYGHAGEGRKLTTRADCVAKFAVLNGDGHDEMRTD